MPASKQCTQCGIGAAHEDGFCSDECFIEHVKLSRLNAKEAAMAKKKEKKFPHPHEVHHKGARLEGWLHRETHKMLAEFCVLVLATVTAEHLVTSLAEIARHAV